MTVLLRAVATAGAASLLAVLASPGVASADEEAGGPVVTDIPCSMTVDAGQQGAIAESVSEPLEQLRIDEAQEVATGRGSVVAVIDAPVADLPELPLVPGEDFASGEVTLDHGTVVAGLIAGADRDVRGEELGVGIAPDAEVIPLRVVADPEPDEQVVGLPPFGTDVIVEALDWVAAEAGARGIDVVNLSLNVAATPELEAAVEAVQAAGVIVVAATANRNGEELPEAESNTPIAEERVYPSAYEGVVGVTTYVDLEDGGEPVQVEQYIKASPDIDVAAPTAGAVSYGPNGSSCVAEGPATSWATAYVSGVLALLREAFPDDDPEELVARLVDTASGVADQRSSISGAGVVQPLEALTREVDTDRRGRLQVPEQVDDADGGRAEPPPVREDELAESRDDFRWWGLLAGAVLVGAVILRPLLRRIRRS